VSSPDPHASLTPNTPPPDQLPGFAFPQSALASIPLPEAYLATVDAARKESQVRSFLPKIFNPLFRNQGAVNRLSLEALQKVGDALRQLADEIGTRDRLMEKLAEHINAQAKNNQQQHFQLAEFCRNLERQLEDYAHSSESRGAAVAQSLQQEIQSLVRAIQIDEQSLAGLQSHASTTSSQLAQIERALQQAVERSQQDQTAAQRQLHGLIAVTKQLESRVERLAGLPAGLEKIGTSLKSDLAAHQKRHEELATQVNQELARVQQALATASADVGQLERQIAALRDTHGDKLGVIEQRETVAEGEITRLRLQLAEALAQAAQADATRRAELGATFDAHIDQLRSDHGQRLAALEQLQTESTRELTRLREQFTAALADASRAEDQRFIQFREELQRQLDELRTAHGTLEVKVQQAQGASAAELARARDEQAQALAALEQRQNEQVTVQSQTREQLAATLAEAKKIEDMRAAQLRFDLENHLAHVERTQGAKIDHLGAQTQQQMGSVQALQNRLQSLDADVGELRSLVAILRHDLRAKRPVAAQPASAKISRPMDDAESRRRFDALYLAFENRFRGTREDITERLRINLDVVTATLAQVGAVPGVVVPGANAKTTYPIIDLGCGRGEWLELLRSQGHAALGVDLNTYFVQECIDRDLPVVQSDAVEFLRRLPAGSVAMVTGFHIIEHLPLTTLLDLIAETHRVLARGGTALFETPNCKNLTVGAANFHCDPTHQNPVFPETAQFLMKHLGFTQARIDYRLPADGSPFDQNQPSQSVLHQLLYGPRDYAVIGTK
jgi:O-antigen chain-terminating methyltransferase